MNLFDLVDKFEKLAVLKKEGGTAEAQSAIKGVLSQSADKVVDEFNEYLMNVASDEEYDILTRDSGSIVIELPHAGQKVNSGYSVTVKVVVSPKKLDRSSTGLYQKISSFLTKKLGPQLSSLASKEASKYATSDAESFNVTVFPVRSL